MKSLLLALLPIICQAQKKYAVLLDSFMKAEVAVNHFNGNVLVAKGTNILYHKAFGYRSYDTRQPLNTNAVFELQSLTKQFTAMGIFLLKEQGKLTLTDSLRRFFSELPYPNVTIRQMLTHTSGLPDDLDVLERYWDHKKVATNKDLIHVLATQIIPLNFPPGAKVEYSNTAYELLASIIERAAGLSDAAFLQKYIFTPLGMRDSHVYTTTHAAKQDLPNFAYGYIYSDSLKRYILPARLPKLNFVTYGDGLNGAGNISSTTGDLLKWTRALRNHQLVSKVAQELMSSWQSVKDSASRSYWTYASQIAGINELGEYIQGGGGYPGYAHTIMQYPKEDITIIMLSNNETESEYISGALTYILTDRAVVNPYQHKEITIDASVLDRYAGGYRIPNVPNSLLIELIKRDKKLLLHNGIIADSELKPESTTKFFTAGNIDQQLEFEVDSLGRVTKAFSIFKGMKKQIEILH